MDLDLKLLGKRIASRRKNLNISQETLADVLNISNNHISSIERGRSSLSLELFCGICTYLKVTPDYLLLGAMRPNNISENVIDSLRLCTDDQIEFVSDIVQLVLDKKIDIIINDKPN